MLLNETYTVLCHDVKNYVMPEEWVGMAIFIANCYENLE